MKADIELHQRRFARNTEQRKPPAMSQGLLVVFTGTGKGKSSAAFNMALRAIANKMKVGVVQFFGGSGNSVEYQFLNQNRLCDFQIFGTDCSWEHKDRRQDIAKIHAAWLEAVRMIEDPSYRMVILDDITLLIKHQYLSIDMVMPVLRKRRPELHIVMAGRYAPFELTDYADMVTEMRAMKHPYPHRNIPPQAGLEF